MNNKKFTIEVEMNERWINTFCSMLKRMELNGNIGHSEWIALFSDGDGDFRPRFSFSDIYNEVLDKSSTIESFHKEGKPYLVQQSNWEPWEEAIVLYDADYCRTTNEIQELKNHNERRK